MNFLFFKLYKKNTDKKNKNQFSNLINVDGSKTEISKTEMKEWS